MSPERRRLLVFALQDVTYAVGLDQVREVVFMAALSEPAVRPPVLRGFLTMGPQVVPVLDLRRLFDLPALEPGLYTPLIVLRQTWLALLVDRVVSQAMVADAAWRPVEAEHSVNGCVHAQAQVRGQTVHVLAVERLLLEQERRCIVELASMEEQRRSALI